MLVAGNRNDRAPAVPRSLLDPADLLFVANGTRSNLGPVHRPPVADSLAGADRLLVPALPWPVCGGAGPRTVSSSCAGRFRLLELPPRQPATVAPGALLRRYCPVHRIPANHLRGRR